MGREEVTKGKGGKEGKGVASMKGPPPRPPFPCVTNGNMSIHRRGGKFSHKGSSTRVARRKPVGPVGGFRPGLPTEKTTPERIRLTHEHRLTPLIFM